MSMHRVMVVDDQQVNLEVMRCILEDDYELLCVDSGRDCLDKFADFKPDAVVMDVDMPEMDGLEACKELQSTCGECPVIFASAKSSAEERMEGYAAGGYDYLVKPIDDDELLAKLSRIIEEKESKKSVSTQLQETMSAFMEAASTSGEMGGIIHFATDIFELTTYDQVAARIIQAISNFGLQGSLRIKGEDGELFTSTSGDCSPIEQEVLVMLKDKGRIYDFDKRTQVNDEDISVLIKNMPEDPNQYGRMKDNIPILLRLANARINNLDLERKYDKEKALRETISDVSEKLSAYEKIQHEIHLKIGTHQSDMLSEFESQLHFLGLTEAQEETLMQLLTEKTRAVNGITEQAYKNDEMFSEILHRLMALL